MPNKTNFFLENGFFDKLAGNAQLRKQVQENWTEQKIRASWRKEINAFKIKRKKYLIYPE